MGFGPSFRGTYTYSFLVMVLVTLIISGCCDCDDPDVCMDADCLKRCELESACDILQNPQLTSFQLTSPVMAVGVIDESQRKISVTVPHGTDLSTALASFSASGDATLVPNPTFPFDLSSRSFPFQLQTEIASKTYTLEVKIARPELPGFAEDWYMIFNNQGIGAACAISQNGDDAFLFNQAGDRYVEVKDGVVRSYSLPGGGPLGGCSGLTGVTAAELSQNGLIYYLYADQGEDWYRRNQSNCVGPDPLFIFGPNGTHPFRNTGIEAAMLYRLDQAGTNRTWHFNRTIPQRAVLYDGDFRQTPVSLDQWGLGGIPFDKVGAALHLRVNLQELYPDRVSISTAGSVQILFNGAGTHFVCYHFEGSQNYGFSEIYPIIEE